MLSSVTGGATALAGASSVRPQHAVRPQHTVGPQHDDVRKRRLDSSAAASASSPPAPLPAPPLFAQGWCPAGHPRCPACPACTSCSDEDLAAPPAPPAPPMPRPPTIEVQWNDGATIASDGDAGAVDDMYDACTQFTSATVSFPPNSNSDCAASSDPDCGTVG
jgi:hypothetical protein